MFLHVHHLTHHHLPGQEIRGWGPGLGLHSNSSQMTLSILLSQKWLGEGGVQQAQINGEKGATGEKAHGENINLNLKVGSDAACVVPRCLA